MIILITKNFISAEKFGEKEVNINKLTRVIKQTRLMEETIATKRNRLVKHYEKWGEEDDEYYLI